MHYTVTQLASLAGVSVRTLHHYDQEGLLVPQRQAGNNYRSYQEADLLALQQILFFRELDFPVAEIKVILGKKGFNQKQALADQKYLLKLKRKRIDALLKTIDRTLIHLSESPTMDTSSLFDGFNDEKAKAYAEEAKQRWGDTDPYKQSVERYQKLTPEDIKRIADEADGLMRRIAAQIEADPASPTVQALIAEHYDRLRTYYEPSLEIYRGLAEMYVADERFAAYFAKYDVKLPTFMKASMLAYCEANA